MLEKEPESRISFSDLIESIEMLVITKPDEIKFLKEVD